MATKKVVEEAKDPVDQKVSELKEKYPENDLFMVDFYYAPVIFKGLDRELYSKVRKDLDGVSDQAQIEETVCDACVLWPEGEEYESLKKKKGGFCAALMDEIFKVSGFSAVMSPVKL